MQQGGPQYGVPSTQPEMNSFAAAGAGGNGSNRGTLPNFPIPGATDGPQQHRQPQQQQPEVVSPISSRPPHQPNFEELAAAASAGAGGAFGPDDDGLGGGDDGALPGGSGGAPGNRWPRHETLALIKIRTDMDAVFRDATLKAPLWEEVSRRLSEQGYTRSAKKCKEKFENVHKYYKRTKEGRAGRHDGKNYRFFSQLEALHGTAGGILGGHAASPPPVAPVSNSGPLALPSATPNVASAATANMIAAATTTTTTTTTSAVAAPAVSFQPPPAPLSSIPPPPVPQMPPAPVPLPGLPSFSNNSNSSTPSSSSESDGEETEHEEGLGAGPESVPLRPDRKRKRAGGPAGGRGKTMAFFSEMMRKLMEQQEVMQQRFLETIERREQERMAREEAWRRQEMARLAREHEMAAQDRAVAASRDAAIIAFLQKISGQAVPPPAPQPAPPQQQQHVVAVVTAAPPPPQPPPAPTVVSAPAPAPMPAPQHQAPAAPTPTVVTPAPPTPTVVTPTPPPAPALAPAPQAQAQPQQHTAQEMTPVREHQQPQPHPQPQPQAHPHPPHLDLVGAAAAMSGGHTDPATPAGGASSSRWPKSEVHALITLRTGLESKYQDAGPKGPLWEEISVEMRKLGYNRNAKRCKEKWENINKYFKKVKESNKKRPEDAKTCPYFHQLDELYRKKNLGGGGSSSGSVPNSQPLPITSAPPPPVHQLPSSDPDGKNSNCGSNRNGEATPARTSNGGMPSGFLNNSSGSGVLKKPEDMIIKELMMGQQQHQRQAARVTDYDMMDTQDSGNMDEQDYDDDDEDDEDDEDEDEQKTAFKIEYQRPSAAAGNAVSNGSAQAAGGNNPPSAAAAAAGPFLAMVQ